MGSQLHAWIDFPLACKDKFSVTFSHHTLRNSLHFNYALHTCALFNYECQAASFLVSWMYPGTLSGVEASWRGRSCELFNNLFYEDVFL